MRLRERAALTRGRIYRSSPPSSSQRFAALNCGMTPSILMLEIRHVADRSRTPGTRTPSKTRQLYCWTSHGELWRLSIACSMCPTSRCKIGSRSMVRPDRFWRKGHSASPIRAVSGGRAATRPRGATPNKDEPHSARPKTSHSLQETFIGLRLRISVDLCSLAGRPWRPGVKAYGFSSFWPPVIDRPTQMPLSTWSSLENL